MTVCLANNRDAERFTFEPAVVHVVVGAHGKSPESKGFFEGHAYDISHSGIRLELDSPLPVGTPVEVDIYPPGSSNGSIRMIGSVVRVFDEIDDPGPRRMGIHLDRGANDQEFSKFERLIDRGSLGRLV